MCYTFANIWFEDWTEETLVDCIIKNDKKIIFANQNMHSFYLTLKGDLKVFFEKADYVHIDGMWLVYLFRFFGIPVNRKNRVTSLDFHKPLFNKCSTLNKKIFILGGTKECSTKCKETLIKDFNLNIETWNGFDDLGINKIIEFKPDILFVGMGMPLQENWILENYYKLPNCVIMPTGGFSDLITGIQKVCPRFLGQIGLEWLFRLMCSPKRLFKRYLIEPFLITYYLLKYKFRDKK